MPDFTQLKPPGQWTVGGIHLALNMKRRASLFKDQRVRNPELEELVAVIDGSTIPTIREKILAFPMQLRKRASVKALEEVPREKKIKITLSSLPEIHAASCSTSKETDDLQASLQKNSDSYSAWASLSTPPQAMSSTLDEKIRLALSLQVFLKRIVDNFSDPEASKLRNNVGKRLVYELLTFLFSMSTEQPPHVVFMTGFDISQVGGCRGKIVFKRSKMIQATLPVKKGKTKAHKQILECPFSGLPNVVGLSHNRDKILFLVEVKADSENRSDGDGQLLISLVSSINAKYKLCSCIHKTLQGTRKKRVLRIYMKFKHSLLTYTQMKMCILSFVFHTRYYNMDLISL